MREISAVTAGRHFSSLTYPRTHHKVKHKLADMIVITICAVISGADSRTEAAEYGKAEYRWLKSFSELPSGIPSHDTSGNVSAVLSVSESENCFPSRIRSAVEAAAGQTSVGGKTLCRYYDRSSEKAAIHTVSAWASENRAVSGQVGTDNSSDEIRAIPELPKVSEIGDCVITADAAGIQKETASQITDKGGDCVPALKGNRKDIYEDVKLFSEDASERGFGEISYDSCKTVEKDHGRTETREYVITSGIDRIFGKSNRNSIKSIGMVKSERDIEGRVSTETRYHITGLEPDAGQSGYAVRGHRSIENSLHRVSDVAFREDRCRIRKCRAAGNSAVIRHAALNLLRQEQSLKKGIAVRRHRAGWDNDYSISLLI